MWPITSPRISARTGDGVAKLLAEVARHLPESPPLYPDDELTDKSMRWLAGELVREAVFEVLSQELPYAMAVDVVEYDEERADLIRIRANLLVERDSQKRIVIGRGGEVIKRIGVRARKGIEKLVGSQVHLELCQGMAVGRRVAAGDATRSRAVRTYGGFHTGQRHSRDGFR